MKKRVFSAALAGCMMLTMVPVTAFAAEERVEGVTEVTVEKYAAGKATLERIRFTDEYTKIGTLGLTDFMEDDANKTLKPVTNYTDYTTNTNAGGLALRNGYYLPLKLVVPGANANTKVVVKDAKAVNPDDPYSQLRDDTIVGNSSYDHKTKEDGEKDILDILVPVARLDGVLKRKTVEVDVYIDGDDTAAEDVQHLSFDCSGISLKPSKYMEAKLEVCTEAAKTVGGKKAGDFYDASTQTVKKVSGASGFSGATSKANGYFLPFCIELDKSATADVVVRWKASDKTTVEKEFTDVDAAEVAFAAQIADTDGKILWDELEVVIYPEDKNDELLSKTLTYDLSDVKLETDNVEIGARLPKAGDVTDTNYLAHKNNLAAVKSVALKNGVLTVTADLKAVDGTVSTIPVLFTMTKDGKSIVKAQPDVKKYGGVSLTDYFVLIDLKATEAQQKAGAVVKDTANLDHKVEFKIVNASKVPALEDSTVTVKDSTMTGLTAQSGAKTATEIKNMFVENGGSVTVTNAAGKALKDSDAVGTGCLVVLKDRDGNVVDTITVVVKGDVTGEGYAHLGQVVAAGRALVGADTLEDAFLAAGDINGNGSIDLGDIVGIGQIVVGAN